VTNIGIQKIIKLLWKSYVPVILNQIRVSICYGSVVYCTVYDIYDIGVKVNSYTYYTAAWWTVIISLIYHIRWIDDRPFSKCNIIIYSLGSQ